MSASDINDAGDRTDSAAERIRRIQEIISRWPVRPDDNLNSLQWTIRIASGRLGGYPDYGMWPSILNPEPAHKAAEQLDSLIKSLREVVDIADALGDDAVHRLTVAGLPQGEDDNPDPGRPVRELLRIAKVARASIQLERGRPPKLAPRYLAGLVWQAYHRITGELPNAYKKSHSQTPPTPFESAVIQVFAVLGLPAAEALRAARFVCKARKAKANV
jgi:hypothetical protein